MSKAPTLLTEIGDLDAAIHAVPASRWAEWLATEGAGRVHGTVPIGPGRLIRLSFDDDTEWAVFVAWGEQAEVPALAEVRSDRGRQRLVDGLEVAEVRDALYAFALRGSSEAGDTLRLDPNSTGKRHPGPVPASRLAPRGYFGPRIEYEDAAVLELFAPLLLREPPHVETGRHLTRRRSKHAEPLLAVLALQDLENERALYLGTLKVRHAKTVRGTFAFRSELAKKPGTLADRARDLGRDLWTLHRTLADEVRSLRFTPRPVTDDDVNRWRDRLVHTATRACDLLLPHVDTVEDARAQALPGRIPQIQKLSELLASKVRGAAGRRSRIHGALSLDRIQRLADGRFIFVDFEAPSSRVADGGLETPLYDLADLARALSHAVLAGEHPPEDAQPLGREVRAALLNGYFSDGIASELIPPTPHRALSLLQLLELEIAFRALEQALREGRDVENAVAGVLDTLDGRRP